MHWAFLAPELSATSSIVRGWIMAVGSASPVHAGKDLPDAPSLVLGQRPRLFEQDPVAHLARIGLVVSFEPLRPRDDPLVAGMAVHALDDHHARLGHLVAHHHAFLRLGLAHVARLLSARARRRALAQDSLGPREVPLGLLYPRRILGHAHRELEPEIEQLFRQLLDLLLQLVAVHLPPARRFHGSYVLGGSDRRSSPRPPHRALWPE